MLKQVGDSGLVGYYAVWRGFTDHWRFSCTTFLRNFGICQLCCFAKHHRRLAFV